MGLKYPRLAATCRARRLPPTGPASRPAIWTSTPPAHMLGMVRTLFMSCRRVHAWRHGLRAAASARSASRLGPHGHWYPHQAQQSWWSGPACRCNIVCASRQSRWSTTSAGTVWSTLTMSSPLSEVLRTSVTNESTANPLTPVGLSVRLPQHCVTPPCCARRHAATCRFAVGGRRTGIDAPPPVLTAAWMPTSRMSRPRPWTRTARW